MRRTRRKNILVVGAGIVGLSVAYKLLNKYPDARISVYEKESHVAGHQSSVSSGVLYSAAQCKPNTLKSISIQKGRQQLLDFAMSRGIEYEKKGLLFLSKSEKQIPLLQQYELWAKDTDEEYTILDSSQIKDIEPNIIAHKAIHFPNVGVINFKLICDRLSEYLEEQGVYIRTRTKILDISSIEEQVKVTTNRGDFNFDYVVNCVGIHSDEFNQEKQQKKQFQNVSFRCLYYELKNNDQTQIHNIVSDLKVNTLLPSVSIIPQLDGSLLCGPYPVLAPSKEGYALSSLKIREVLKMMTSKGFRAHFSIYGVLAIKNAFRAWLNNPLYHSLSPILPSIKKDDFMKSRANVISLSFKENGEIVDDIQIEEGNRVFNIISGGISMASGAFGLADTIVEKIKY